jgi:hypothetical protein
VCSRDAKEERETAMSVEETAAMARAREHTRERERRARVRCSRARLSSAGPPRAGMGGPHPRPRYVDAKFLICLIRSSAVPIHEFITLKFIRFGIIIYYFIISHFHP